jgi:hypothetical protein
VENQSLHRRPVELMHPHKLLECTAFKTQAEWDRWKSANKHGMGKTNVADPLAGISIIIIIIFIIIIIIIISSSSSSIIIIIIIIIITITPSSHPSCFRFAH